MIEISTPNEDVVNFTPEQFPFHVRHYTVAEFKELLSEAGFYIVKEFSQFDSQPISGFGGKYNIAICQKTCLGESLLGKPVKNDLLAEVENYLLNANFIKYCINNNSLNINQIDENYKKLKQKNRSVSLKNYYDLIKYKKVLAEAFLYFQERNYQASICLLIDNKIAEKIKTAFFYIGSAYEKLGQYEEALAYFYKAEKHEISLEKEIKGAFILPYSVLFAKY